MYRIGLHGALAASSCNGSAAGEESGGISPPAPERCLLRYPGMTIQKQFKNLVGKRNARWMSRALPYVTGALAFAIGGALRERRLRASGVRNTSSRDKTIE